MDQTSINAAGVIDTFLVLLIGIGPKLALVPFVEITASLDPATKRRVLRKMLTTAAAVAVVLMVLGELLRALLHFTIGSLSIAGGVILLVLAVWMVLGPGHARCRRARMQRPDLRRQPTVEVVQIEHRGRVAARSMRPRARQRGVTRPVFPPTGS